MGAMRRRAARVVQMENLQRHKVGDKSACMHSRHFSSSQAFVTFLSFRSPCQTSPNIK